MNRETESRLLAFCVEQRSRFDAAAWMQFSVLALLELAAVSRYLAGVAGMATSVREVEFEPGRFAV